MRKSITINNVTYNVTHVFQGEQSVADVIAELLINKNSKEKRVDAYKTAGYNDESGPVHQRRRA